MSTIALLDVGLAVSPLIVMALTLLLEIEDRHILVSERRHRLAWAHDTLEADGLPNPSPELVADKAERIKLMMIDAGVVPRMWLPRHRDAMAADKKINIGLTTILWSKSVEG